MVARGKTTQQSRRGSRAAQRLRAPSGEVATNQGESSHAADRQDEDIPQGLEETQEVEVGGELALEIEDENQAEGMDIFGIEGEGKDFDFEGEAEGFTEWMEDEDAGVGESYGASLVSKEYSEEEFHTGDALDDNAGGEGNHTGTYVEEGVRMDEECGDGEMLEEGLDEAGEFAEQVHEDFEPESIAGERRDAAHGDDTDVLDNADEEDHNIKESWEDECERKAECNSESINKSVKLGEKQDQHTTENFMGSESKTKRKETGDLDLPKDNKTGEENDDEHDKEGGDKSFEKNEEKADGASSSEEEGETEEQKLVRTRKQKQIQQASIPRCLFGPAFDKSHFKYSICVRPVVQNDFTQRGVQVIAAIADSVSFVQDQSSNKYKVMKLLTTFKIGQLMEKILFSTFGSNNLTIEVERREPTEFIRKNVRGTEVEYPVKYTKVLNKVSFKQKNAYTRRYLMGKQSARYLGKSVKQRSLFLQNLPSSMDEHFLRILFPRSFKVGLVKVSSDVRSAVLQMSDYSEVYHHLICFTNFEVDGRDIQMGIVDLTQEEALIKFNLQKTKEGSVNHRKTPTSTAVSASEAQREQGEKASDSRASKSSPGKRVSSERKTAQTSSGKTDGRSTSRSRDNRSSSIKKDVASSSRISEKTSDTKKDTAAREQSSQSRDQEKQDQERKDRQKSEKERNDRDRYREHRELNSKERERQRVSRERQRQRREDMERGRGVNRRREERGLRLEETQRIRRRERELELQRELRMQREIKMRREMEMQLEFEKQRELERLKMEQLQELERQKVERQQKEQLQLIMLEQERQLHAREEAARKLKEMEYEEGRRREREKEERRREEERKREREQERRRQQEQQRKRRDQDRGKHEKASRWEPPAAKKSRFSSPPARQQHDSYEDSFDHSEREMRQDHRSPGQSGAGADFGQGLLRSPPHAASQPQASGDHSLRQTLEQEVAKQAEELQRNLALLAEFQNDPSRAVRNLAKINPSLTPISSAGRSMPPAGHANRSQETVLKQQPIREVAVDEISGSYVGEEYRENFGRQSRPHHSKFQQPQTQQQQRERLNQPVLGRGDRREQTSAGRGIHMEQSFEGHLKQASFGQGGHMGEFSKSPFEHSSFERGDYTNQSFATAYTEEPYYGQDEEMEQPYYGEEEHTNESSYGSHMGQSSSGRSGHMNQPSYGRGGQMAPSSYGRGGQMAQSSLGRNNQREQPFGRVGHQKQQPMVRRGRGREPVNEKGSYHQPTSGSARGHGLLGKKPDPFDEGDYQQQHMSYEMFGNERQMQAEPAKAFAPQGQRGRGAARKGDGYRGRGYGGQGRGASRSDVVDYGHGDNSYAGSQNYY